MFLFCFLPFSYYSSQNAGKAIYYNGYTAQHPPKERIGYICIKDDVYG